MESPQLQRMRADYARAGLSETDAGDDPVALFGRWLDDAVAAELPEPNAMALATATPDGRPSVRIVLLKGFDAAGLVLYTGYTSRKGQEVEANPHAAVTMLWHPLQRQVRVEGTVSRVTAAETEAYFHSRPRGSQVGALASPQSQAIADRGELEARVADVEASVGGGEVPVPEAWGGYRISLDVVEFWQGRQSRLHDRLQFTRTPSGWTRTRLAP